MSLEAARLVSSLIIDILVHVHLVRIDTPRISVSIYQGCFDVLRTHHQVLRAALQLATEFDMDSVGNPMANAVRTAMPQYI